MHDEGFITLNTLFMELIIIKSIIFKGQKFVILQY